MKRHSVVYIVFFIQLNLHVFGQDSIHNESNIRAFYESESKEYAVALSKVLLNSYEISKKVGFLLPNKVFLNIKKAQPRMQYTRYDTIALVYISLSDFQPPIVSGLFQIYGMGHELGHMVMFTTLGLRNYPKISWMSRNFHEAWADYYGSILVDSTYKRFGMGLWPIQYDYSIDGLSRFAKHLNDQDYIYYYEINAWNELSNLIGFKEFSRFFKTFRRNGFDQDAFFRTLNLFIGTEATNVWRNKYWKYIINKQ